MAAWNAEQLIKYYCPSRCLCSSENELFLLDRIAVDDGSDGIARFEWITGRHAVRAVSSIDSYIYSDSLAYIDSNFSYSFLTRWLEFSELFNATRFDWKI